MQTNKLKATWFFQALADDTRLRIIRLLSSTGLEATPGEISKTFGLPPSHLTRHLQVLAWAGLISIVRQGRTSVVSLVNSDSSVDAMYSSVLSVDDDIGIFAIDVEKFLSITDRYSMQSEAMEGKAK